MRGFSIVLFKKLEKFDLAFLDHSVDIRLMAKISALISKDKRSSSTLVTLRPVERF